MFCDCLGICVLTATWRSGYAAVCKFAWGDHDPARLVSERPELLALPTCSVVRHPFLSPNVSLRSVANSVATYAIRSLVLQRGVGSGICQCWHPTVFRPRKIMDPGSACSQ